MERGNHLNLLKFMKQHVPMYFIAITALLISIVLDMISPMVTGRIIDGVIIGGQLQLLNRFLLTLLSIGAGRAVFGYLKEYIFDLVSVQVTCDIRKTVFQHIQKLPLRFFDNSNTGELLARLKDDVDKFFSVSGFVGMLIIESIIHVAAVLFCMFRISPKLTVIPLMLMPAVAFLALRMESKLGIIYDQISEANARMNTIAQENLAGVRTVKAFAREEFEIKKFQAQNQEYYTLNMNQAKCLARYQPNITFLTRIMIFMILLFGGFMVMNGELTLGKLGAFAEYGNNILWPMEIIGWLSNEIASAYAANKKLRTIMVETSEIKEPDTPLLPAAFQGELEFKHVSFAVDNNEILKDISFHLKPGKTLGIMGMTGAGKTSIVNLIERFYDPTEGEICLDQVNIRQFPLKALRQSFALVMQDLFLFSDTISENIRIGKRDRIPAQTIETAASHACAHDFISRLTDGYETVIGERGVGLSGGQKQRISIARAIAKETPILILDDSTSALDMETEYAIQQELELMKHTSKIIIAHRISAVRHADEILILQDGEIVERGTHDDLMTQKGYYYDTYVVQYEEPEKEAI